MARYERALRRLSIFFILLNLLGPLSTAHSLAQEAPLPEPPAVIETIEGAPSQGVSDSNQDAINAANAQATQAALDAQATQAAIDAANVQAEIEAANAQAAQDAANAEATRAAIDVANADATQAAIDAANAQATQDAIDAANAEATQVAIDAANAQATQDAIDARAAAERATGGLEIHLAGNDGVTLSGGATFSIVDSSGNGPIQISDGVYPGDTDGVQDGVIRVVELRNGPATLYQTAGQPGYAFTADAPIYANVIADVNSTRVDITNTLIDADYDGILDSADNCLTTTNPGQEDTDGNGAGDACDEAPAPTVTVELVETEEAPISRSSASRSLDSVTIQTTQAPEGKIGVCHRTEADKNPWTFNLVAVQYINGVAYPAEGHIDHVNKNGEPDQWSTAWEKVGDCPPVNAGQPNLTIAKTPDGAVVAPGETITFTITVSNTGGFAQNVTFSDTLPAGFTWVENVGPCSISGNVLSCNVPIGGPGSYTVAVSATVPTTGVCGPINNTASFSYTGATSQSGSDTGSVTVQCATEVFPALPTVAGNVCVDGTYTPPTVTPGDTAGITYSGGAVDMKTGAYLVTATLDGNYVFGDLTGTGWTPSDDGRTATYTDTLVLNKCKTTSPATIVWSDTACTDGEIVDPTFMLPANSNGITYSSTGSAVAGGKVVVTATLGSGYIWGDLDGWVASQDGRSATRTIDFANPDCAPSVTIKKTASSAEVMPGGTIGFTVTVTNEGTGNASGIAFTDVLPTQATGWAIASQTGTNCAIESGTLNCSGISLAHSGGAYSVTVQATAPTSAADCGAIYNTASLTSGGNASSKAKVTVKCDPKLEITKTADKDADLKLGDTVTYTIVATNLGNVPLTNVSISDDAVSDLTCNPASPVATLAVGGTITCTATHVITSADILAGEFVNTATADSHETAPITATKTVRTVAADPSLTIEKSASPAIVSGLGDMITYTFVVTNDGNVPLDNIAVTDQLAGLDWAAGSEDGVVGTLEAGTSATLTATYTVTQADVDAGNVHNSAIATGDNPDCSISDVERTFLQVAMEPGSGCGVESPPDTTDTPVTQRASITLDKTATQVNGTDAASAIINLKAGDKVTYTLIATNDGNVSLTGVGISDPMLGTLACDAATTLAPGEILTCTGTYTVTQTDINAQKSIVNTATAIGTPPKGDDVADTDTETVSPVKSAASMLFTKKASAVNGIAVSAGDGSYPVNGLKVNDKVTYELIVTNDGNVTLGTITVRDPMLGTLKCTPSRTGLLLEPGASVSCTGTYTVTQADIDAQADLVNVASADSNKTTPVSATETVKVAAANPSLLIEKTAATPDGETAALGTVITYTFTVTNNGNVTMENIVVHDQLAGVDWDDSAGEIGTLAPGKSTSVTATYTVTQADVDAGTVHNSAIATGDGPGCIAGVESASDCGVDSPPDTTDTPVTQDPSIGLEKTASHINGEAADSPVINLKMGDKVTYTLIATNDGTVTLTNIAISDPMLGTLDCGDATTLAPGESQTCTGTYTVTQSDVNGHKNIVNEAMATGTPPKGEDVSDTATETVSVVAPAASMSFDKKATAVNGVAVSSAESTYPVENLKAGDVVTYTMIATNDGNITLTGITVRDPMLGTLNCTPRRTGLQLDPGASITCSGTYTVTQADINGQADLVNVATADSVQTPAVEARETVKVAVANPSLDIAKSAATPEGETVGLGTVITYTFVVTNDGNVTMDNIVITDQLAGLVWAEGSDGGFVGTLAPAGTATLTATYTVTQADVNAGNVHNSAIATGDGPMCDEAQVPTFFQTNATGDDCGLESPPSETDTPVGQNPAIDLVKTATLVNGEAPDVYPVEHLMLGDVVTYEMIATNTGDVTLTDVSIVDPMEGLSGLDCDPAQPAVLAPGDTLSCVATYTIGQDNIDNRNIDNEATVTGTAPDESTVSDSDDERVVGHFEPILAIDKTADRSDDDDVTLGTVITYTFKVTNTGNVTIHDIFVEDQMVGLIWNEANANGAVGTLGAGESASITATYTVTADDIAAGSVHNVAIATGELPTCIEDCDVTSPPDETTTPTDRDETQPVNPIVVNTVCIAGGLTEPTLTTTDTNTITYTFNAEDVVNGGTVIVTATITGTSGWGEMPNGWTMVNSTTATYTVELADVECEVGLPIDPVVLAPTCVDGSAVNPSITLPESNGIVYTMSGDVVPGGTVVVTATVTDGYAWESTELEGWTFADAETATFTVTFEDPTCELPATPLPVPTESPKPAPIQALPSAGSGTGTDGNMTWVLALTGATLAAMMAAGIRRRAEA